MKFTSILKKVILEQSRFELLSDALTKPSKDKEGNKVKPKMSREEFNKLVEADPTTRLNNVDLTNADSKELEKVKAGKYVQWLIKQYLMPKTERQPGESGYEREVQQVKDTFMEDLYKVTDDLAKFEKFKGKIPQDMRDINKLTPDTLYDTVKDFDLTLATTTKAERKSAPVHPGAKLVFDGPTWRVIEIENKGPVGKEAACFYGGNNVETRWCTSTPGTDQWFNRYIKDGPLYVIIPNTTEGKRGDVSGLPAERYQFHFPSNQFMDVHDRQQDLVQLLNGPMKELKNYFKPEFVKGLSKDAKSGKELVIDYPRDASSKYVALYGWDELFKNIDPQTERIDFTNSSNESLDLSFPKELANLKNLQTFYVEKGLSKVPDELKNLKNLEFLSLPNNPNLKELPEWIADLPNLIALSVKGSNSDLKIPERLQQRFVENGGEVWFVQN